MSVWIIVGAFCLMNSKANLECSTILYSMTKYKTESKCLEELPKGGGYKCLEAHIMNNDRNLK